MSEADPQFELVEFEQVEAAPGTALLRVSGRPAPSLGAGPLTLVIGDERGEHRHEQLPSLPGSPDLIRAAFSAPLEELSPGATYSLALPDGDLVRLPAPTPRRSVRSGPQAGTAAADLSTAAAPGDSGAATGADEPVHSGLAEAEALAESRRLAIAELEHRLQTERERRTAAESEMTHIRTEREDARAERDAAIADRDVALADRDEAEARARAAAATAGTLEAQLRASSDNATRTQTGLEAELADRAAELGRIRNAAEVAQARAHASRRDATELDEQLAHAQAQMTVLQQQLDEREADRRSVATAFDNSLSSARDDTAAVQSRLDVANAELEDARTEVEALRRRSAELQESLLRATAQQALAAQSLALEASRSSV